MLTIGTDCSGLDAVHEALLQTDTTFSYEFASDICPVVRQLLRDSVEPPRRIFDDVTKRDHTRLPTVDIYCAGYPCQTFSTLGSGRGLEDARGTIFYSVLSYVATARPRVFILENVSNLLLHDKGKTWAVMRQALDDLDGYVIEHRVLSPHEFGWPQSRGRVFIVGRKVGAVRGANRPFAWPEPRDRPRVCLESLLLTRAAAMHAAPTCVRELAPGHARSRASLLAAAEERGWDVGRHEHIVVLGQSSDRERIGKLGICPCLTTQAGKLYLLRQGRYLCPQEALVLQGFRVDHPAASVVSPAKLTMLAGNSIHVGLLRLVLEPLLRALE
jgi:DNA (cytosine-5)-methyltransferase 1